MMLRLMLIIEFIFGCKNEAVNRMTSAYLIKKGTTMKLFTIVISNNTSEAKTNQQRHYEKNKEKYLDKSKQYYEENKKL